MRIGRFGSAEMQKVQLFALLRFGPPRTGKYLVHVCKSAKVTFCIFYFLKFSHFHHFLTDGSNPYVFPGQINDFAVQTLQIPLFALFRYLAPPSDPSAPALMFSEVKSMVLGAQSPLFAKKCGVFHFFHFGHLKTIQKRQRFKGILRYHQDGRTFSSKVHFWSTFGTLGPRAGWLAG